MFRSRLLLTLLVMILWPFAGVEVLCDTHFSIRVWQVKDGLPQSQVRAILQSSEGYIWVATNDGLARFDGVRFLIFNRDNTPALRSSIFTGLHEDRAGTLWISSDGGLVRYRGGEFTSYSTTEGLASDHVAGVAEGEAGQLYIITANALHLLQNEKIVRLVDFTTSAGTSIRRICVRRSGEVWLATNRGAIRISDRQTNRFTVLDGLPTDNLNTVIEDRHGSLWFGTIGHGVIQWNGTRFNPLSQSWNGPEKIVHTLIEDKTGRIWAGTQRGVYRFAAGQWTGLSQREGLPSNFVTTLADDREGSLWVGTDGGGLAHVRESGVRVFTSRDGLAGDLVRSIAEAPGGGVWIASWFSESMTLYRDGRFQQIGRGDPLLKSGVRALLVDRHGVLWLAVGSNRLVRRSGERFIEEPLGDEGPPPPIFALAEDREGRLWLGRSDGLKLYEAGQLIDRTATLGLPAPGIRSIIRRRQGGLWVGSESGLILIADSTTRLYTPRDGLPYPFVTGLYEDCDGVLWVGTRGGGLSRFENGHFTNFTKKEGLPSDSVYQILEDDDGYLWCGSSQGVFRVSRHDLNRQVVNRSGQFDSTLYGHPQGTMTTVHFGTHPSASRTGDGRLWFPTVNGVLVIEPDQLQANQQAPGVTIEQISIDKTLYGPGQVIEAPPGRGDIEIHYNGLSFVAPERVAFRYRLAGFEADWVEAGSRRTAWYTNLPPGDYSFHVIAGNNDGVWNEQGAVIHISLRPHYYQTWWFHLSSAIAIGALGWLILRQRVRQVQTRHALIMAERNSIAREIHDTLAQEVAGLLAQLQVVKTLLPASTASAERHLDRAVDLARKGLADARRLVLDLRHQALENDDLATAIGNFIDQLVKSEHLRINYQIKGSPRRLAADQENNLMRISQESVANAIRHSGATEIDVTLTFESHCVELSVRDNGCGFDPSTTSQGQSGRYGLLGIRERAAQICGELAISSRPGQGTEIQVRIRT
jgi:ligand-binding sensor domain-containing protein/signal transduction histidine kinase